jgi:hypothetical protein
MRKIITLLSALSLSASLVSCASGPTFAESKAALPALAPGQGRVFVYRPSSFGGAVSAKVKMDNQVVGTSRGGGYFFTDQAPGSHEISIKTEWNHKNTVQVAPGQATYVRCHVTPGVLVAHIIPNQVPAAQGEKEIQSCKQGKK